MGARVPHIGIGEFMTLFNVPMEVWYGSGHLDRKCSKVCLN